MLGWAQPRISPHGLQDTKNNKTERWCVVIDCLEKFRAKMQRSGNTCREERIRNSRELLDATFSDDTSFAVGVYRWKMGLDDYSGEEPINIRMYKRSFSNANGSVVKFQTLFDTPILTGDILYVSNENYFMICTEVFNINNIHWQGKFTVCNWMLRWQNKNGDILEYPCYNINTTQYNSGESSNRQFTIGSSQHQITLPADENTIVLDTPQRFFLDKNLVSPTSYIVTQNDTTSYSYGSKGLIKLTLLECATNNDTDRIDLGICDYINKSDIKTDNTQEDSDENFISRSVISYDTTVIKSGGDPQIFVGRFFDENGVEITTTPNWEIICEFKDVLKIEITDNYISIGIDDDRYVDEIFKLTLSDSNSNYTSSLIIKVESLL